MPRPVDAVRRLLLIAAPARQAGRMETRLVADDGGQITPEQAHALADAFLRDTTEKAARRFVPCDVWLALDGAPADVPEAVRNGLFTVPQEGADFGEVVTRLFARGFAEGYDHIILIGSKTPHLPPAFLIDAWGRMRDDQTDIVLGPTDTGGYYLLGLKLNRPELLQTFAWSASGGTLGQTRDAAQNAGLHVAQIPVWYAIDTWSDVQRLRTDIARGSVVASHTQAALSQLF